MSWRKHFRVVTDGSMSPVNGSNSNYSYGHLDNQVQFAFRNYQAMLPDVYSGHPNRVDRYTQYENMDMDSEINAALDILAEFCTQNNEDTKTAFNIHFHDQATDNETSILKEQLVSWYKLNDFDRKIFKIFRNTLKYGDQIFIRDPETYKWFWSEMNKVSKVVVNESQGKVPEVYYIKDLAPNLQNDTVTSPSGMNSSNANVSNLSGISSQNRDSAATGSRFGANVNEFPVNAEHVIHLSLTEGLDLNWPFGVSLLESVFKVFKQKELLEDALLIYRVQRAPERRVFYIDVGNMPPHLQMSFMERVKNEIHQRRIPTQAGGGQNLMDASYNPLCLDLETRIPLLDGRTLSLNELIKEFENGKENWAYSCEPNSGKVVPGLINWAGITRTDTEAIKLTFDNGKTLICTPDHKIPVFEKGFVEAQHLTTNDSLISFNKRLATIGSKGNTYQQVWNHETKTWVWTHKLVGEFFKSRKKHQEFTFLEENASKLKSVIHHKDDDRCNNDPRNLTYMNKEDHILYHAAQTSEFWNAIPSEFLTDLTDKISETLKLNWPNLTNEERLACLWNIRQTQTLVKEQNYKNTRDKIDFTKFCYSKISNLLATFSYKIQKLFVASKENFNCKIVKIETIGSRDTGTITIDGTEKWHNYHTFAIESGIFIKNSINEDYFFPQSAEGRGSKVDVLPGGNNLGEIDDLRYFQNKLFRGLRIPSSYLPTGKDDSDRAHSDGKVTTALIQEYRFNEYCKRLQKNISTTFDEEFKIFLLWRGFNLDNSLFELRFAEPQNFAAYREIEVNSQRIQSFGSIKDTDFLSKRFVLKKYLGLTEIEMAENDKLWHEERGTASIQQPVGGDMRNVGITPGGITGDLDTIGDLSTTGGNEMDGIDGIDPGNPDFGDAPAGAPGGAPAPTVAASVGSAQQPPPA